MRWSHNGFKLFLKRILIFLTLLQFNEIFIKHSYKMKHNKRYVSIFQNSIFFVSSPLKLGSNYGVARMGLNILQWFTAKKKELKSEIRPALFTYCLNRGIEFNMTLWRSQLPITVPKAHKIKNIEGTIACNLFPWCFFYKWNAFSCNHFLLYLSTDSIVCTTF